MHDKSQAYYDGAAARQAGQPLHTMPRLGQQAERDWQNGWLDVERTFVRQLASV